MRLIRWLTVLGIVAGCTITARDVPVRYRVEGDAIREPVAPAPGDPRRGRELVFGRDGNCLLCHAVPDAGTVFMGNVGPALAGVGARLSEGQLRLRIVDSTRLSPATVMPSYYRVEGLNRVAPAWRGKPLLTAQEIDDVVAFLRTLR